MKKKKNKITNLLKLGILFFGISLLLWNCEKEETITEPIADIQQSKLADFKGYRPKADSLFRIKPNLAKFLNQKFENTKRNNLQKSIYSDIYGFNIDTSAVQLLSSEQMDVYTFLVKREEQIPTILENYVLTVFSNGEYIQMLTTYSITEEGLPDVSSITVTHINDESLLKTTPCGVNELVIIEWDPNAGSCVDINCSAGGNHSYGQSCNGDDDEQPQRICSGAWVEAGCTIGGGGGAGDGNGPFDPPTGGGGTNNPPNDDPTDDQIPIVPLEETAMDRILECMNTMSLTGSNVSMPQSLIDSLNSNRFCQFPLDNFIQDKGCTFENKVFAIEAARACLNGDEVDYINAIIIDSTFQNTQFKCIHDKFSRGVNLYSNMLSKFNGDYTNILIFNSSSTLGEDWGITKGSIDNTREFTITTNSNLDDKSNLLKMVTLSHELIHAYMMDTLEDWNFISYDTNDNPILNINCPNGINFNAIDLNTLSVKSRFVALICAMNVNGTLDVQWFHEMFNQWNFEISIYRENLEIFILNQHDWESESQSFKDNAQSIFGNDWKEETARAVSWIGLELTDDYPNYISQYQSNVAQFSFITDIKLNIENLNSECP